MQVSLDRRVAILAARYKITVLYNRVATEPRFEAWGPGWNWGIHWYDPNKAVLDCATAIRKGIVYPYYVPNECDDGREIPPSRGV